MIYFSSIIIFYFFLFNNHFFHSLFYNIYINIWEKRSKILSMTNQSIRLICLCYCFWNNIINNLISISFKFNASMKSIFFNFIFDVQLFLFIKNIVTHEMNFINFFIFMFFNFFNFIILIYIYFLFIKRIFS